MDRDSKDPAKWTQTTFVRSLLRQIGSPEGASERAHKDGVCAEILRHAKELVPDKPGRPTASEVASDVMWLVLRGSCGTKFRDDRCPVHYLRGLIRRAALAFDSKHRRRGAAAFDPDTHDRESSASGPLDLAIASEQRDRIRRALERLASDDADLIRRRCGLAPGGTESGPMTSDERCRLCRAMAKLREVLWTVR